MKNYSNWKVAVPVAAALVLASVSLAQAPPKGQAIMSSVDITATVVTIDHKTREVTLKADDGEEYSFVAGPEVANLDQVNKGDVVTATYTEALAFEVKKGGTTGSGSTAAAAAAPIGSKPAGVAASTTTVTVKITAIDTAKSVVTFVGPKGNTKKLKVQDPTKLQGVKVGDTVDFTYVEAVGLKVTKATKK
jgi:Cu/Ag efflux protein CusF